MTRNDRLNELAQTRLDYWSEFVRHMRRRNNLIKFNDPSSKHQLRAKADTFGSGKFILVALAIVSPESIVGVGVEISGLEEYFTALRKDESIIRSELGYGSDDKQGPVWKPDTKVRDVWLLRHMDFIERHEWPEQHEWLREKLESFHRVLEPRIKKVLSGSS